MAQKLLSQPPFLTSLMGVVIGAAEYHGLGLPGFMVFGGSGHAFLMNTDPLLGRESVHDWGRHGFSRLLANLGVLHYDLGHFGPDTTSSERNRLENGVKNLMTRGVPCSVRIHEHQLLTGFDETGFFLASPPVLSGEKHPDRLDFVTWRQLSETAKVSFHGFDKTQPARPEKVFRDSLEFASAFNSSPGTLGWPGHRQGLKAYDRWLSAVDNRGGEFSFPGRIPALVYGECRGMASAFLGRAPFLKPEITDPARRLEGLYSRLSQCLAVLPDSPDPDRARAVLSDARTLEKECLKGLETVFKAFDS